MNMLLLHLPNSVLNWTGVNDRASLHRDVTAGYLAKVGVIILVAVVVGVVITLAVTP